MLGPACCLSSGQIFIHTPYTFTALPEPLTPAHTHTHTHTHTLIPLPSPAPSPPARHLSWERPPKKTCCKPVSISESVLLGIQSQKQNLPARLGKMRFSQMNSSEVGTTSVSPVFLLPHGLILPSWPLLSLTPFSAGMQLLGTLEGSNWALSPFWVPSVWGTSLLPPCQRGLLCRRGLWFSGSGPGALATSPVCRPRYTPPAQLPLT